MPIPQATAASIEQRDSPMTSHFRFGLHKEKEIDLTPLQKPVGRVLKFKAESAVRKQKWEEEGLKDGKPPSELDQAAAEIWKKLQENDGDLGVLSVGEIGQVYFILRDIDKQGVKGEYFQDAVRNIRDVKEKRKIWNREKTQTKIILTNLEERLVGRPYWKEVLGWKTPEARNLLVLEDLVKKHGGNIEKAAASFATDQIEAVLGERMEEIKERVGADKIEAAKKSSKPEHRRIAKAIEGSSDLAAKGIRERKKINQWTKAGEFRSFTGEGLTESDLSHKEIILSIIGNNADLFATIKKTTDKEGDSFRTFMSTKASITAAQIEKMERLEDLEQTLVGKDDKNLEFAADALVELLRKRHSFNSVVDTAYSTLERLGEKLPAVVEPEKVIELAPKAGEKAEAGDIILAITSGMTDSEMQQKGFKKEFVDEVRRKYFYREAGQYKLKEVAGDSEVDQEQDSKKIEIHDKPEYLRDIEQEKDILAQESAQEEFRKMQNGILPGLDYESQMVDLANSMSIQILDRRGVPTRETYTAANISDLEGSQYFARVKDQWTRNRKRSEFTGAWRDTEDTKITVVDRIMRKKPEVALEYYNSLTKIKANEIAGLGPQRVVVLRTQNKLQGNVALVETALAVTGRDAEMTELIDPTTHRLYDSHTMAEKIAVREGIPVMLWASLVNIGVIKAEDAIGALYDEEKTKEVAGLKELLTNV